MASLTDTEVPEIPMADFQPDSSPTTPGIIIDAQGAFPSTNGFQCLNSPMAVPVTYVPPSNPIGMALAYFSDGTAAVYAASATNIYNIVYNASGVLTSGAWSECDNGQTFAATSRWKFFQFGDDVIAVAAGVAPQVASGSAGQFSALAGSPPFGATDGVSAGGVAFLFKGQQWFSSATGADSSWVPNIQTQAGTGFLYDFPGPETACATLYRNIIVFKQNAIWLGQFQGQSTAPWSFQLISDFTGTWGQGCICLLPNSIAFVGTDDFYLTTGYTPQAIPNKLKKWFFANAPLAYRSLITSQFDPENGVIYWYFVSVNNSLITPITPDRFVAYNTRSQRWGVGYPEPGFLSPVPLTVPTLPNQNTSFFIANTTIHLIFDITKTFLYQRNGPPGSMVLSTGYLGTERHLSEVFQVRIKYNTAPPLGYPTSIPTLIPFNTESIGAQGQGDRQGSAGVLTSNDWFNIREYNRFHRFALSTTGPVEVMGYSYSARQGGTR